MTSRERIQAALRFEIPDRLPRNDSPWTQTLERWRGEGYPAEVDVVDHFDFDIRMMFLDLSPRFDMRVLERKDGRITYEDRYGYTLRKEDGRESTIEFLHHRNRDRRTWEREFRPRLVLSEDPAEPSRLDDRQYFGHFDPYPSWEGAVEKYNRLRSTGSYLLFMCYGPWEASWRHRGMVNLLMDIIEDPRWIEEMAWTHVDLLMDVLARCLQAGARPDGILLAEDLGHTGGPLFSPTSWDHIFRPALRKLGEFLGSREIDFWIHSDGRIHDYVERFIQIGVKALNPLEVKAGMDAVDLRNRFGKNLCLYGNISARAMAGPRKDLERELLRKIPLAREGGFILHSDHSVPPEVGFEQFSWMQKRAQEIFQE